MTSDDPKFKILAGVFIALGISVMALNESRKQDLIQHHVNKERLKHESTLIEHEKAKQQIEVLQLKNGELEKLVLEAGKK